MVQKIYPKMHLASCSNISHGVTDLVNHGMFKTTKTWISWEQNITFLQNKKILNLCLRWHILRSYCFLVEVTFKVNFKITSQPGKQTIIIHILYNISRSKGNQTMKQCQLIEYIMRNILLQKSSRKWGWETSSRLLFVFKKGVI